MVATLCGDMPLSESPSKKKGVKEPKKNAVKSGRAASPGRRSKGSGRKFQTVSLELSTDLCGAVLNRLPPQGPPTDIEAFDQNRWLEEQLALTRQMQQLYTEDGGGAACASRNLAERTSSHLGPTAHWRSCRARYNSSSSRRRRSRQGQPSLWR